MNETPKEYTKDDLDRIGQQWLNRIAGAEKRDDSWFKDAERAEKIYLCDNEDGQAPQFNILHSNVETIVPSIYNSTPSPEIRARHGNLEDGPAKDVSEVFERVIATQVDDNRLDTEIEAAAQDAYAAGRAIVRVRFEAETQEQVKVTINPETGDEVEVEAEPLVTGETILYENVSWRDYRQGPAKRWRDVPWVCYRHEISEQERERLENPEFKAMQDDLREDYDEDQDCTIWEIWDKEGAQVLFVVADSGKVLDIQPDPMGLKGFFPQPAPVQPITPTGKLTPVCPYVVYESLAKELDTTTRRINALVKGLKVRGAIAGNAEAIEQISQLGDNELVAVGNIEGLVAAGGLAKAVMWWPIDTAIAVLRELYVQRDQTKQAIYEVTGISDIVRGQGAASETATAQRIKTQWGSLRIKKMQRGIERQVRDLFVLSAEIISKHFSEVTLQKMTGLQMTPEMMQIIGKPLDHYRINVESDSTVRADLTKSRGEMSEFLQGTAQFFSTMAPIVQQSPQAAGPLAKMYAAFATQFNLGKSAEDALDQFVALADQAAQAAQQPQGPSPEQQTMEAELKMRMQDSMNKMELEMKKLGLQTQNLVLDGRNKEAQLQLKQRELGIKEGDQDLAVAKAEMDAISRVIEVDMEQTQERPVKVG